MKLHRWSSVLILALLAPVAFTQVFDPTFGVNGCLESEYSPLALEGGLIDVLPDSSFVIGGDLIYGGNNATQLILSKYSRDGVLDTSFGTDGWLVHNICTGTDRTRLLGHDPQGRIILAGWGNETMDPSFMHNEVIRVLPNGTLDSSFADGGIHLATGYNLQMQWAKVMADGRVLVFAHHNSPNYYFFYRLDQNGAYDTTFNGTGLSEPIPSMDEGNWDFTYPYGMGDFVVDSAGVIYLPGRRDPSIQPGPPYNRATVLKIGSDGLIDTSFGMNGYFLLEQADTTDSNFSKAMLEEGRLLLYGSVLHLQTGSSPVGYGAVFRLTAQGELDTTYGDQGHVVIDPIPNGSWATYADTGRVVIVASYPEWGLRVFNSDFQPDVDFGSGGIYPPQQPFCYQGVGRGRIAFQGKNRMLVLAQKAYGTQTSSPPYMNTVIRLKLDEDFTVGVATAEEEGPIALFPNPCRAGGQLSYEGGKGKVLQASIHDVLGRTVAVLASSAEEGTRTWTLPASLRPGMYIFHLDTDRGSLTNRLVIE